MTEALVLIVSGALLPALGAAVAAGVLGGVLTLVSLWRQTSDGAAPSGGRGA